MLFFCKLLQYLVPSHATNLLVARLAWLCWDKSQQTSHQGIWEMKQTQGYFPLNPDCLMTGSLFHGLWNNPYIIGKNTKQTIFWAPFSIFFPPHFSSQQKNGPASYQPSQHFHLPFWTSGISGQLRMGMSLHNFPKMPLVIRMATGHSWWRGIQKITIKWFLLFYPSYCPKNTTRNLLVHVILWVLSLNNTLGVFPSQ